MDTMTAFMMGQMNRGRERMVFDWDKAARIIKEKGIKDAMAGLSGDFPCTGGTILENGEPVMDDYTYLASTWATPVLSYQDDEDEKNVDGVVEFPCFVMEHETEWNEKTKWPESALRILKEE